MTAARTRAETHLQPAHRSFWRSRLEARAGDVPLDDWLVEQANLRRLYGAFQARPSGAARDGALTLEDIVVGLCQPHAPADARTLKLVVRILQSGRVNPPRLAWMARKERAHFVLFWLLSIVPTEERNQALEAVAAQFCNTPRGYREPRYRYDPRRLVRRQARVERLP
jgi:hypothetical protein